MLHACGCGTLCTCAHAQACNMELQSMGSAATSSVMLEAASISSIRHHGMTFSPDSWMLYYASNETPTELVYVDAMFHVSGAQVTGTSYLKVFRFPLTQLGAAIEANTIRIQCAAFQNVLDAAPPSACDSFMPSGCLIRGRWVWTLKVFTDNIQPGVCRTIHFSRSSITEMIFTFR